MKKHKNLIVFLIITFLRSIFLGMLKIFLRSTLKEDNRTLEEIAGYISLGAALSYIFGGALTYTFRKKHIAIIAGIITIGCLIYGFMTDYFPLKNFAVLVSVIGFLYGLRLTIKGILTTTEIMESGIKETKINAIINTVIFIGLLTGSYRGFDIYERLQNMGVIGLIGTITLASVLIICTNYDKDFKQHTIRSAITKNIPNILGSIKRYFTYLIPIGTLRAISTAVGQKMLEIGIDVMKKEPTKGITIIVVSMIGAIVGHIISTRINKQKIIPLLLTILLAVSIMFFPGFLANKNNFLFMSLYSTYLGIIFGIIVNIIETKFYHKIGEDNRKEFGSASYGIITSMVIFLVMIAGNIITKNLGINPTFVFYGIVTILGIIPFIIKIK